MTSSALIGCCKVLEIPVASFAELKKDKSIPEAARSKAWVWGRSLPGNVSLNPAGGMDVFLL